MIQEGNSKDMPTSIKVSFDRNMSCNGARYLEVNTCLCPPHNARYATAVMPPTPRPSVFAVDAIAWLILGVEGESSSKGVVVAVEVIM